MEKEKENQKFSPEFHFCTILPKGHSFIRLPYCTIEVTAIKEVIYRDFVYENAVSIQVTNREDECSCK